MGFVWRLTSAILSRLIFVAHAVWCLKETIYRIHVGNDKAAQNSPYWTLTIVLGLIALEGAYTLIIRKGNEYKFFWPTGFFYIGVMISIVCILEIFLLHEELKCIDSRVVTNTTADQALLKFCNLVTVSNTDDQKLRSAVEIGMLGALVIGRWLLPRGELTRDQLSALLLTFISNGADVIEFLNTWNDFPILRTPTVTYTVLVLYSWSLLQFAVITTKTTDEYEAKEDEEEMVASLSETKFIEDSNLKEEVTNQLSPKKHEPYDPNIPRYLQKFVRKGKHLNKRGRSRTSSVLSAKRPSLFKRSSFKLSNPRSRTHTTLTLDQNKNYEVSTNKPSKIRFSQETKTGPKSSTPHYLQYLAQHEQWDEFASTLKTAQDKGFTKTEDEYWDEDDDVFMDEKTSFFAKFDQDVFQTCILLLSLELPYFVARVSFTVIYNVSSITMIFYTTKNTIMIIFLIYRLWVILSGRTEDDELK